MKFLLSLLLFCLCSFSIFAQGDQELHLKKVEFVNMIKNDPIVTAVAKGLSRKVGIKYSECEVVDLDSIEFNGEFEVSFQGSCTNLKNDFSGTYDIRVYVYDQDVVLINNIRFYFAG